MVTPTWEQAADEVVCDLAATGRPFTADDVVAAIGHPDPGHTPNSRNNVIGAIFRRANAAGLIEVVGYAQSSTPTRKGGLIRQWRGRC